MTDIYLNQIATAVPAHDVHDKFVAFAPHLLADARSRALFGRMAARSGIARRFSVLAPHDEADQLDRAGFYRRGAFPGTQARMRLYEDHAFALAQQALDRLAFDPREITHVIVTSCTGFYAPGLDFQIVTHYGLSPSAERIFIGFMGCHAALGALKSARHIVRSEPESKVLILNLELCTLHLQQEAQLEEILSFLIFADGCAASLVSAQAKGLKLQSFHTAYLPDSREHITWKIGDNGFAMHLSGRVPGAIAAHIDAPLAHILNGTPVAEIVYWAVHPGGRSVLDGVQDGLGLAEEKLATSRKILNRYGNMSSPTIMFVLDDIMRNRAAAGVPGVALAFGPGLSVEAMRFAA